MTICTRNERLGNKNASMDGLDAATFYRIIMVVMEICIESWSPFVLSLIHEIET